MERMNEEGEEREPKAGNSSSLPIVISDSDGLNSADGAASDG